MCVCGVLYSMCVCVCCHDVNVCVWSIVYCIIGMHRYRYQYRYRCRYFVKILVLVLVVELPIPSTDTIHQYFTASNWPGYADTKCDLLSYLSYHSLPD